jgi:hypothetical protein
LPPFALLFDYVQNSNAQNSNALQGRVSFTTRLIDLTNKFAFNIFVNGPAGRGLVSECLGVAIAPQFLAFVYLIGSFPRHPARLPDSKRSIAPLSGKINFVSALYEISEPVQGCRLGPLVAARGPVRRISCSLPHRVTVLARYFACGSALPTGIYKQIKCLVCYSMDCHNNVQPSHSHSAVPTNARCVRGWGRSIRGCNLHPRVQIAFAVSFCVRGCGGPPASFVLHLRTRIALGVSVGMAIPKYVQIYLTLTGVLSQMGGFYHIVRCIIRCGHCYFPLRSYLYTQILQEAPGLHVFIRLFFVRARCSAFWVATCDETPSG